MGEVILVRHGQTTWSVAGKHTGRTDIPLTAEGEAGARALAPLLAARVKDGHPVAAVLTSPAQRARRTAELALDAQAGSEAPAPQADPDLWEWDYGGYEGMTTAQIQQGRPGWYLWRDGVIPGDADHPGESVEQVGERADRMLAKAAGLRSRGDVIMVAHGHVLRVLAARYLELPAGAGRHLRLDTGTMSVLGFEHAVPVIQAWNLPPQR